MDLYVSRRVANLLKQRHHLGCSNSYLPAVWKCFVNVLARSPVIGRSIPGVLNKAPSKVKVAMEIEYFVALEK